MITGRRCGVLLHISSLPSRFGIGDLGPEAYRFLDFLERSGQRVWQLLPLTPTAVETGNSPYSADSAFAGNPLLVSPELLVKKKFLFPSDLGGIGAFPKGRVDYERVTRFKLRLLDRAFERNRSRLEKNAAFRRFVNRERAWLDDYALFRALGAAYPGTDWAGWPVSIRDRRPKALSAARRKFSEDILREKFFQFLFFDQWEALKRSCARKGIQVLGDLPIYVQYHSADVWSHPRLFKLDRNKRPAAVAGIPPDFFSATGQLWGNPIYRWDLMKRQGYRWWIDRLAHHLKQFDEVRLDHFKGFVDYWEVPAHHRTAQRGRWVRGPRDSFFAAAARSFPSLPLIVEDLGVITPDVIRLRDRFGLPGMRVLQFAFGSDPLASDYLPCNYVENCVAYTGTHDNDTLMGWLTSRNEHSVRGRAEIRAERDHARAYLGPAAESRSLHREFIRLVMMSSAGLVIFPVQDLLGLDNRARMNRPGTAEGNWAWRLSPGMLTRGLALRLGEMTKLYRRV